MAINSVEGKAEPGAPFGKGPKQALELGLEICRELGLEAVNCEDKIGYGQIGDAEDYLATITHLDVVPVGEGWTGDPFTLMIVFLPLYLLYELSIKIVRA